MTDYIQRLKPLKDDPLALGDELTAIAKEIGFASESLSQLIQAMLQEFEVDILQYSAHRLNNNKNDYIFTQGFEHYFKTAKSIKLESLIEYFNAWMKKSKQETAVQVLYEHIRARIILDKRFGLELEKYILTNKSVAYYKQLLTIQESFEACEEGTGLNGFLGYAANSDENLAAIGLRGIGSIVRIPDSFKNEILNRLQEAISSESKIKICSGISTIYRLSSTIEEAREMLIDEKMKLDADTCEEILNQMQFKREKIDEHDFKVLDKIYPFVISDRRLSQTIDLIIYNLVTSKRYEDAERILSKTITNSMPRTLAKTDLDSIFHSAFYAIGSEDTHLSNWLLGWLNSNDSRLHFLVAEMTQYLAGAGKKHIHFQPKGLEKFKAEDYLYIVRKIMGYINDHDLSLALTTSLLKSESLNQEALNHIIGALYHHYGYNFPHKTIVALESIKRSSAVLPIVDKNISTCVEELEKMIKHLSSSPKRNELNPNLDHSLKLQIAFRKSMAKVMKSTASKSPLMSMATKVEIQKAKSWFSYNKQQFDGQFSEPTKMGSFQHTLEMPRKLVLDETGYTVEKALHREFKRGNK